MANNNIDNNENILVKVDQNNIIFIDPNSVVSNGEVKPRNVRQEELVIYVNLEADLVPRTTLLQPDVTPNSPTLVSIASNTMSFLKNGSGKDYDTMWSEAFTPSGVKNATTLNTTLFTDSSGQSFGIDSVNINIKGTNFVPSININFIDVRGKTLFESPHNSPYSAFFHLPWPIFYLTVKGQYGKAIKFRLHLVDLSTKYNESNGNFEVATTFVGSTYAYLNDIPFNGVLNAAYMYPIEITKPGNTNTNTNNTNQTSYKTTKGYQILNGVYKEYISKGLLPENFPTITVRELITKAKGLDGRLEKAIFDESFDPKLFSSIKEYSGYLDDFEQGIRGWSLNHLLNTVLFTDNSNPTNPIDYFALSGQNKNDLSTVTGATTTTTLEWILTTYTKTLQKSALTTQNFIKNDKLKDFKFNIVNKIQDVGNYIKKDTNGTSNFGIAIHQILKDFYDMYNQFIIQKNKFEKKTQDLINEIVSRPENGIGFDPTLRNMMGVLLANADVYIRLLKDVHQRAFNVADERNQILKGFSKESTDNKNIYPWPDIKKQTANSQNVVVYPGNPDMITKLKSDDSRLWPEVEFVETYQAISTKRVDPLANKEGGVNKIDYLFEKNGDAVNTNSVSTFSKVSVVSPYIEKSLSSILYEIIERMRYITLYDTFTNSTLVQLADLEFNNIKVKTINDIDIVNSLLNIANPTNIDTANGITNAVSKFLVSLQKFSPYQRYPYYVDDLPTVPYIQDIVSKPYSISQYDTSTAKPQNATDTTYSELTKNLLNYTVEEYRHYIYPFNSPEYLSYLGETNVDKSNLKLLNFYNFNSTQGYITTPLNIHWNTYSANELFFNATIDFGSNSSVYILNTPYFHKQLFSDFNNNAKTAKYAGSAYLLLTSMGFIDLDNIVSNDELFGTTLLSTMIKEVGATHGIPYHLILKWGAIYHRYKNYILNNTDILSGFLNTSNVTQGIDGETYFYNDRNSAIYSGETGDQIFIDNNYVSYDGNNIGIHPFYDDIFHSVVNDYELYSYSNGFTSYESNITSGAINNRKRNNRGVNYWTNFVDESKIVSTNEYYTLLPCDGANYPESNLYVNDAEQNAFRIIWETGNTFNDVYSGKTFASYYEYCKDSTGDLFDVNKHQYRKILDLIGTFTPDVLEEFENLFLDFASERATYEIPTTPLNGNLKYTNFQDLLKAMVTVPKSKITATTPEAIITQLSTNQATILSNVAGDILSKNNYVKLTLANPKNLDLYVLKGFLGVKDNRLKYNPYINNSNAKYITLHLGQDIDGNYLRFFQLCNVELTEENVLQFRALAQIFAGGYQEGLFTNLNTFKAYLLNNVLNYSKSGTFGTYSGILNRQDVFMTQLVKKLKTLNIVDVKPQVTFYPGYNEDPLKLEMYSQFKSFNDKWIAGNSIGQRLLLEEFLFLDKANQDIGNRAYISLQKIMDLDGPVDDTTSLYSIIGTIIEGSNFLFRALPSYINFYGTNYNTKSKKNTSADLAKSVFGTFLEVDTQESSPKIILQYVGPSSKTLDLSDIQEKMKFKDDSGNLFTSPGSPLLITNSTIIGTGDLAKANKVVAFEVNVGDQAQGIFKGVQLDQTSLKNTYASQVVNENIGRSESGAGAYQIDVGLYDIFRQVSYTCHVSMMGNMMIQPTMFFYLKNIPMFRGSYWITEVSHNIKNGNIETSFTGVRMPFAALPDPKDTFLTAYRALFDMVTERALAKVNSANTNIASATNIAKQNEKTLTTSKGESKTIDMGSSSIAPKGVKEKLLSDSFNLYGIAYNGYKGEKYVQKIQVNGQTYLRAVACTMGGKNNKLDDKLQFNILSKLNIPNAWGLLKNTNQYYYTSKFQIDDTPYRYLNNLKTTFLNPNNGNPPVTINHNLVSSFSDIKGPIGSGPGVDGYGVALSPALMSKLGLYDGQVVYFSIS
jgi:hypothetical protein